MIRTVTRQEVLRGTWRGHGKVRYGFWYGFYGELADGVPVELGMDGHMVKATDRRDGSTVARFGSASKFWFAPIPMPRDGEELIYVAEGDNQEYRVRVVDTSDTQYSRVTVELVSDGMEFKVRAERLRYDLDALHADALAEDAVRPWPAGRKRYTLEESRPSGDMRMRDRRDGTVVAVLHNVTQGWAPQLADGTRLDVAGSLETAGAALARVERFIAYRAALAAVPELVALDEGPAPAEEAERGQCVLPTLAVTVDRMDQGGAWQHGHPLREVSTDQAPQQLAEQISAALDTPGKYRVLVWECDSNVWPTMPAGQSIVTVTTATLASVPDRMGDPIRVGMIVQNAVTDEHCKVAELGTDPQTTDQTAPYTWVTLADESGTVHKTRYWSRYVTVVWSEGEEIKEAHAEALRENAQRAANAEVAAYVPSFLVPVSATRFPQGLAPLINDYALALIRAERAVSKGPCTVDFLCTLGTNISAARHALEQSIDALTA